jgi:hypothetical protein
MSETSFPSQKIGEKISLPVEIDKIAINLGLVNQPVVAEFQEGKIDEPKPQERKFVVDFDDKYLLSIINQFEDDISKILKDTDIDQIEKNKLEKISDLKSFLREAFNKLRKESQTILSLIYRKDNLLEFLESLLEQDIKYISDEYGTVTGIDLTLFKNRLLHLVSFGSSTNRGSLSINRKQFEEQSKTILEYLTENPAISADCFIKPAEEIYNEIVLLNKNKALQQLKNS